MITRAYRTVVPKNFRLFIYSTFLKKILYYKRNFGILTKSFLAYRFGFFKGTEPFKTFKFIGQYGLRSCPAEFSLKYDDYTPEVYRDELPYVLHQGKRLYFPALFTDAAVQKLYKSLVIEQDPESAHRYSVDESEFKDSTMFDIGAAEGILTLEKIEQLKFAYLVECEAEFVEALNKTFEPYQSKVKIIFKYIDQHDSESTISLDTLGKELKGEKIFLKMDIEGYDRRHSWAVNLSWSITIVAWLCVLITTPTIQGKSEKSSKHRAIKQPQPKVIFIGDLGSQKH